MTGLPFFEGFAPASIRTTLACLESVERELAEKPQEQPLRLVDLIGDEVTLVEAHPCGTLMRFRSGAAFVLSWMTTYDTAGLRVIEP